MNKHSKVYKEIIKNKKAEADLNRRYILQNQNNILKDLEIICSDTNNIIFFYETIMTLPSVLLENKINDFVYFAIYGNPTEIYCFREIVLSMDKQFIKNNIEEIIRNILDTLIVDEGYLDYLYLNIISLYRNLGEEIYLKNFLINYCKDDKDVDIQEIYEDYI